MNSIQQMKLDYGNCEVVKNREKETYLKDVSPRTLLRPVGLRRDKQERGIRLTARMS